MTDAFEICPLPPKSNANSARLTSDAEDHNLRASNSDACVTSSMDWFREIF